ncbi:MAG: hypothetical protein Q8R60_02730 [Mycobacteriales bacterium]|nr:hypothetical protein [Mycobacteriales bacterium]
MTDVKAIAAWTGWCDPCGTERPLSLTEAGPRGFLAWVRGISWEDRELGLYCRVCGVHQVVPLHEEDDPVVVTLADLLTAPTRVGLSILSLAPPAPDGAAVPVEVTVPAARAATVRLVPVQRVVSARPEATSLVLPHSETTLDLIAAGLVA